MWSLQLEFRRSGAPVLRHGSEVSRRLGFALDRKRTRKEALTLGREERKGSMASRDLIIARRQANWRWQSTGGEACPWPEGKEEEERKKKIAKNPCAFM